MSQPTRPSGLSELVNAMLEFTAPITQMLDHMVRAPGQPDIDECVATLRGLLCEVLEPLATVLAPRDLRTTTAVIEATVPLILEELLLVPHELAEVRELPRRDPRDAHRGPNRAARRSRSRGSH